ncbi:MAG TPA: alpha/beta hydrolase [Solirubrobacteraceae bacterium]
MSSAVHTSGSWIGPEERPLMAWLSVAEGAGADSGVLVLPPVGYAYWSSHRTLRVLAEDLAEDGHMALRLDYDATGDSAGAQSDLDRVAAWRASVRSAAAELRGLGCRRLVVVGVRLGATFALLDGAELGADAVVAWAPVISGRRYVRELKLMSMPVPTTVSREGAEGAVVSAGSIFTAQTLTELAALDVSSLDATPAARVMLVDGAPQTELADRLREAGGDVTQCQIAGGESALETHTEYATVPAEIVHAIRTWIGPGAPGRDLDPVQALGSDRGPDRASGSESGPDPRPDPGLDPSPDLDSGRAAAGRTAARLAWGDAVVAERVLELGPERFVGIMTEPETPADGAATVVFLNSGSEPHIGPGRAWVEYARALAVRGHRCLRVDFRGWGESPDEGHAPGRLYDAHCRQDTIAIVRALRESGHERIVLVGLCASAWVALRAVLLEPVAGVIALNPQLYWRMGDPIEATLAEVRLRRTPEREREQSGGRWGLWSVLDRAGHRPWAGRWLDELSAAQTDVVLVFAEDDDGIEYLRNRLSRRLRLVQRSGGVRVVEMKDVDHSMYRLWLRPAVVETLHEQIELCGARGSQS